MSLATDSTSNQEPQPEKVKVHVGAGVKIPLLIISLVALFGALDYAQSLILPIVLAFIMSLTLTPINLWLQKRIYPGISAFLLVAAVTGVLAIGALTLSQPIGAWIDNAPSIGMKLRMRLAELREPVEAVTRASKEVEDIASATSDPEVREVVLRQPGLMNRAATNIGSIASTLVVAIALSYFLLATNRLIYEKIVQAAPKLSDKKRSLTIVNNIVTVVSKYLLTITVINACFGLTIGLIMWLLGMPSPVLWGLAGFLLNYLPFVGSLTGTASGALVGLLTYNQPEWAIAPALAYFTLTTIEGNFITPSILGHRLELNPVAILISIALWGFIWGVAGIIIAVPLLIIIKVMCDNIPALAAFGEFLSGATAAEQANEEPIA
ncbi:AI-2E family transporter [Acuticoccus mangrovi]|uniref:AI-2E family transporter n=1 Tax=Acuticoccus mangrovi TaxID=2796142 RepID=A0A934IDK9_9HYPH|nr:AI-2E family transporter [Acuticoccus mangrovi]MBJ3774588.1 AI-2E family transporter [Acuticoccus mangrovi]